MTTFNARFQLLFDCWFKIHYEFFKNFNACFLHLVKLFKIDDEFIRGVVECLRFTLSNVHAFRFWFTTTTNLPFGRSFTTRMKFTRSCVKCEIVPSLELCMTELTFRFFISNLVQMLALDVSKGLRRCRNRLLQCEQE